MNKAGGFYFKRKRGALCDLSRLQNPEPCTAQINPHLDFPVARLFIRHRVKCFVEIGQQPQPVLLDVPIGLDARLVFVEAHVGIQACHTIRDPKAGRKVQQSFEMNGH